MRRGGTASTSWSSVAGPAGPARRYDADFPGRLRLRLQKRPERAHPIQNLRPPDLQAGVQGVWTIGEGVWTIGQQQRPHWPGPTAPTTDATLKFAAAAARTRKGSSWGEALTYANPRPVHLRAVPRG